MRFAIVVSRYNQEITSALLQAAVDYLHEQQIDVCPDDIIDAPGAFELPLLAQALARTRRYDGIICLGCVIKGDTAHFELISLGATLGILQASLATETPIAFGVLTTYTDEQAEVRAKPDQANKGREAAAACYHSAQTLSRIKGK